MSLYETEKYGIQVAPNQVDNSLRFHIGEEIRINWQAPQNHSRKDWIGIYRVRTLLQYPFNRLCSHHPRGHQIGANQSRLVTKTSSLGMWVPVHGEEWDGDLPIGMEKKVHAKQDPESGQVVFKGDTLPWQVGKYEVRSLHSIEYGYLRGWF